MKPAPLRLGATYVHQLDALDIVEMLAAISQPADGGDGEGDTTPWEQDLLRWWSRGRPSRYLLAPLRRYARGELTGGHSAAEKPND